RPHRGLRLDVDGAEAVPVGLDDEAEDLARLLVARPHDGHVGARAGGDPALHAGDHVVVADAAAARAHRAGVGAGVGLGEAEAAHRLAADQPRQPLVLQLVARPTEDRVHHQRGLHAHERAQARVDVLDLAADQAVGAVAGAGAAVALGQRDADRADLAEYLSLVLGYYAHQHPLDTVLMYLGAHLHTQ